jgi:UDP-2,3-diacylglucosamine pyrophosphatase LpxH
MSDDRIILFSDVHAGASISNRVAFSKFVDWLARDPPGRLVILGDLLDFWRRNNAEVLVENKEVLNKLFGIDTRIDDIIGNHDYAIWDIADRHAKDVLWPGDFTISKDLRFECGGKYYYCTHGYDLDVAVTMEGMPLEVYEAFAAAQCRAGDGMGSLASLLWDGISLAGSGVSKLMKTRSATPHDDMEYRDIYDILTSGAAHLLCGAHPGDRIVSGHTHWPFCTKDQCVANTGSWCTELGIPRHNTYVEISAEGMELKDFV